jgi:tRNA A-37 threonylcarbamoyl transferase component Bud32
MDHPLVGRQLANYRVERLIKRGGMAQVYYGWDLSLERPVAIKTLDDRYKNDPVYAERLVAEARAVASWRHPHIAQTYYAGSEGNLTFFVMEYIDGLDLAEIIASYAAEGRRPAAADALHIGRAVAGALDYAHEHHIVHRDVKPANIMVAADGQVFLMDFGLALDAQEDVAGAAFGTARYIAPEQARSAGAVPQSDIYSLGVVLYEMLAGRTPFDDPSPTSLIVQHITQPPPSPRAFNADLNEATEVVLLRALRKAPAERYAHGRELVAALQEALGPAGAEAESLTAFVAGRVAERQELQRPAAVPVALAGAARSGRERVSRLLALISPWLLLATCGLVTLLALAWWGTATLLARATTEGGSAGEGPAVAVPAEQNGAVPAEPVRDPAGLGAALADEAGAPPEEPVASSGRPVLFLYDSGSFYLWNPGPESITINHVAFEALDGAGAPAGFHFHGGNWAAYFPRVEPGKCVAIEIWRHPHLRPAQCQGYNAVLSPEETADSLFWLTRDHTPSFRLLWDGQEIARCATVPAPESSQCEVMVP